MKCYVAATTSERSDLRRCFHFFGGVVQWPLACSLWLVVGGLCGCTFRRTCSFPEEGAKNLAPPDHPSLSFHLDHQNFPALRGNKYNKLPLFTFVLGAYFN